MGGQFDGSENVKRGWITAFYVIKREHRKKENSQRWKWGTLTVESIPDFWDIPFNVLWCHPKWVRWMLYATIWIYFEIYTYHYTERIEKILSCICERKFCNIALTVLYRIEKKKGKFIFFSFSLFFVVNNFSPMC